ncbi:hypothetical protein V501_00005 [Pseudogymnoascus sp. VKM F-4519 (FW-2642)]|nr:hypothetical protein V501_00005 [Pseudogymnoascus sp. VKM F-4519 (FW-2642)]
MSSGSTSHGSRSPGSSSHAYGTSGPLGSTGDVGTCSIRGVALRWETAGGVGSVLAVVPCCGVRWINGVIMNSRVRGSSAKIYNLPFITPNPDLNVYAFLQRAVIPDPKTATPGSHCTIDFPNTKHYQSADGFFAGSNIELVIVCSHPDSHASFVEKALRARKHVVVEKPFTTTTAEADRVIAIAKESGKILTCYQIWMVRNKTIEYTPGEGMTFELGAHSIDQALVLFGKPASVTAFLRSVSGVESEIDDTFTIILQYSGEKKNLLITIKTAIATLMQDQLKTFVRGTKGSFIKFSTDV